MHVLPYRQVYGLGDEGIDDLEDDFTVAGQLHIDYSMYLDSLDPTFPARQCATVVFVNPVRVYHA